MIFVMERCCSLSDFVGRIFWNFNDIFCTGSTRKSESCSLSLHVEIVVPDLEDAHNNNSSFWTMLHGHNHSDSDTTRRYVANS